MTPTTIADLEEVYLSDIQAPFTIMGRAQCDLGPYTSINFILSTKKALPTYVILGEREEDFNSILLKTEEKKKAEREYYHVTSKYLFK